MWFCSTVWRKTVETSEFSRLILWLLSCKASWLNFVKVLIWLLGFPGGIVVKNLPANAGGARDVGSISGSGKIPWRGKWQSALVFLPGKFHGQRSLVGYLVHGFQSQIWLNTHLSILLKAQKKLLNGHISGIQISSPIRLVPMVNWLGPSLNCYTMTLSQKQA